MGWVLLRSYSGPAGAPGGSTTQSAGGMLGVRVNGWLPAFETVMGTWTR